MVKIPSLDEHCNNYKDTTPFPDDLAHLYLDTTILPWAEYFVVLKHTDIAPLELVGKDFILKSIELDDRAKRWVGKCVKTIMIANGYEIILHNKKPKTKRISNEMFGRGTCYKLSSGS